MFFEFLTFKCFSFLWKFSETSYNTLEIVKHNHLEYFSYNSLFFTFYKIAFFITLIKHTFVVPYFARSSLPEVFCKEVVLRSFTKFTGRHLCQSLFFNKVAGLRPPVAASSLRGLLSFDFTFLQTEMYQIFLNRDASYLQQYKGVAGAFSSGSNHNDTLILSSIESRMSGQYLELSLQYLHVSVGK